MERDTPTWISDEQHATRDKKLHNIFVRRTEDHALLLGVLPGRPTGQSKKWPREETLGHVRLGLGATGNSGGSFDSLDVMLMEGRIQRLCC